MKAKVGDRVVTGTGFNYYELVITSRTANTIATRFPNGSPKDYRANPAFFRAYEKAKFDRLLQLDKERAEKKREQREIYHSLAKVE